MPLAQVQFAQILFNYLCNLPFWLAAQDFRFYKITTLTKPIFDISGRFYAEGAVYIVFARADGCPGLVSGEVKIVDEPAVVSVFEQYFGNSGEVHAASAEFDPAIF
jgi:hypothetical protein